MTRRALSWLIGGGVALLALFALATTVPLVTSAPRSAEKVLTSDASESESTTCATVEFAATFHYSVTTPVLSLWGFRSVDDVTINPARLDVAAGPTCNAPAIGDVGGAAYIQTDPCPADVAESVVKEAATTNRGAACDDTLIYYSVQSTGAAQSAWHEYLGPQRVAGSGFGRGEWCPVYSSEARYTKGDSANSALGTTTRGDLCLDAS